MRTKGVVLRELFIMHAVSAGSRPSRRVGKWMVAISLAACVMLGVTSDSSGRPFGGLGRKRDDKENRPWTYASGAMARGNPPLADIQSAPAIADFRRPESANRETPSPARTGSANSQPKAPAEPPAAGDPLAAAKMHLLEREIVAGLRSRGIEGDFYRFGSYLASQLVQTSGPNTGSEVTGNCRLSWYDQMLRNPLRAPAEAEQFTRLLHEAVLSCPKGLAQVLAMIRHKLDLPNRSAAEIPETPSATKALEVVQAAIVAAKAAQAAALAPLSKSELQELAVSLYPVLTSQNSIGHTLNDRGTGRRMCDLLERMDRDAMFRAAEALLPLANKSLLSIDG